MPDNKDATKAIALVGMCGAGKSIVAEYLRSKNWTYIRFGQVTIDELDRRNLAINEQNERSVREELRTRGGMGIFARMLWPQVQKALKAGCVVIDGLYSWSEYKILKEQLGNRLFVVAVTAARETRYARLIGRSIRPLSWEDAEQRDIAEIENLEKGGPIAIADFTLLNDSSIEQLHNSVAEVLRRVLGSREH